MDTNLHWDVVIIGAGPAGCSAAAMLAEKGRRVVVLERNHFPRYHVGESLLPFTYYPLRRLGLLEKMRESAFVRKHSVQFVSQTGDIPHPFYFSTRYDEEVAQTWQVLRSEFDQMLMEHAREKGATVLEGITVKNLLWEGEAVVGVEAADEEGHRRELRAPMTLDASGREAFSAVKQRWRARDPQLNKIAVWTYYKGAKRDPGIDAGATTVAFVPRKGWFWYIPLHYDWVSVGVVGDAKYLTREGVKKPEPMFQREVPQNAWIQEHLACGKQEGPYYITSEYSFHSRYCGREGLLLLGDAFCFIDPVFSSGLMLALKSGVEAADAVDSALAEGDLTPMRFAEYGASMRLGIENMRKLIYAFYDTDFSFGQLTRKYPDLAGDVTDCLSGDVNKDFSRLWEAIAEFAEVPDSLPYGQPLAHPDSAAASV